MWCDSGGATGVLLAGGRSTRLGRDKALLTLEGEPLLVRTARTLRAVTGEVLVVGRDSLPSGMPPCVRAIPDRYEGTGPLGGMAAGLAAASAPHIVVVACDMPFLDDTILRYLLSLAHGYDAVVPVTGGIGQPLHAVYARTAGAAIEAHLRAGRRRVREVLKALRVRWVDEDELRSIDPKLLSFLNVNTRDDWETVCRQQA